jgi:oxalate decarboxylase
MGNSFGKEATVEQLPISKGIAGVSMRLEPGAMRELHWHPTAAEWAFVLKGRVRRTVINPAGQTETNDFELGDIWYFPRGHAHMLECLGDEPTHFILIFDNGYFSEFGIFSITDWIGHAPKPLLVTNFGLPESTFDGFPKEEVYFARGSLPPEQIPENLQGASRLATRDAQISNACRSAARDFQRRSRMAHRFHPISYFDDSYLYLL